MSTLSDLRTETRRRVGELSTAFFSDAEINSLLNEAQLDFSSIGGVVEGDRGFALVANQYEYSPPSDFINTKQLLLGGEDKLLYVTPRELFNRLNAQEGITGTPTHWSIWAKVVRVYPAPNAASSSTTLNGALTSSATTITVVSTSGFPTSGRAIIDSEEVQYFATSTTQLLQVKRGQAGTTAASHLDAAAVREAELRLFYYKTAKAMSADSDAADIPAEYHYILPYYAAGMLKIKDRQYDQSTALLSFFEQKKREAWAEIRRRQRDRNPRLLPADGASSVTLGQP